MTLEVYTGATFRLELTYKDSEGQPIDVSADSAEIRFGFPSGTNVFAGDMSGGATGAMVFVVDDTTTSAWAVDQYNFQVWLTEAGGDVKTLYTDRISVKQGIVANP